MIKKIKNRIKINKKKRMGYKINNNSKHSYYNNSFKMTIQIKV
jgi:hypothetical protein